MKLSALNLTKKTRYSFNNLPRPRPISAATLMTTNRRQPTYTFCKQGHASSTCNIITDIAVRKNVLRHERHCFTCLKHNHVARNRCSNIKCHECGQRHRISVCTQITNTCLSGATSNTSFAGATSYASFTGTTSQQRTTYVPVQKSQVKPQGNVESQQRVTSNQVEVAQQSETSHQVQTVNLVPNDNCASQPVHVRSNTAAILQTAKALVTRVDCNDLAFEARVPQDTGSQRSYVSTHLREALGLRAIGSDTLIVKTLRSNYSQVQSCDVATVSLRTLNDDLNTYIKAFTIPTISSPIACSHLSDLPLADFCVADSDVDVDMLIGADYFCSFVTEVVRRGEEGPVATETKLGWVWSGIVSENSYDSVSLVNAATHCMEVLSVSEEEQQNSRSEDQLRKFWELKSIGIPVKGQQSMRGLLIQSSILVAADMRLNFLGRKVMLYCQITMYCLLED